MTGPEAITCLTTWGLGVLLACIGAAGRAVWRRTHRRAVLRYPIGQDATHPRPPMPVRPVPPVVPPSDLTQHYELVQAIWEPNPMRDTLIIARPLGWDGQPRQKEY